MSEAAQQPGSVAEQPVPDADQHVPLGVRVAASWAWRMLVIGALVVVVFLALQYFSEITVPVAVAVLLTAALEPAFKFLVRHGVHRGLAAAAALLVLFLFVGGVLFLVGAQIASQWRELYSQIGASVQSGLQALADSPLHIDTEQLTKLWQNVVTWAKSSEGQIATTAAGVAGKVGTFFAGIALALFGVFFFLFDREKIGATITRLIPRGPRPRVADALKRGWVALVAYVRAAVIVAAVDGVGAGIGAAAVGSNLFLAIGALTFITAFVPLLGALTAGAVATIVVLATLGWVKALIMLAVFVLVMELESHVLQPFLLGKAVSVHPLAVLYGLTIGTILAGIVGAIFSVPVVAFGNAFIKAFNPDTPADERPPAEDPLADGDPDTDEQHPDPDELDPSELGAGNLGTARPAGADQSHSYGTEPA